MQWSYRKGASLERQPISSVHQTKCLWNSCSPYKSHKGCFCERNIRHYKRNTIDSLHKWMTTQEKESFVCVHKKCRVSLKGSSCKKENSVIIYTPHVVSNLYDLLSMFRRMFMLFLSTQRNQTNFKNFCSVLLLHELRWFGIVYWPPFTFTL